MKAKNGTSELITTELTKLKKKKVLPSAQFRGLS